MGYIILNPETGEAAYMISGGLCGGESSSDISMILTVIIVAVATVMAVMALGYFSWMFFVEIMNLLFAGAADMGAFETALMLLATYGLFESAKFTGATLADGIKYAKDPDDKENYKTMPRTWQKHC